MMVLSFNITISLDSFSRWEWSTIFVQRSTLQDKFIRNKINGFSYRNKQGLLPVDYAVTKAMKAALAPPDVASSTKSFENLENIKVGNHLI